MGYELNCDDRFGRSSRNLAISSTLPCSFCANVVDFERPPSAVLSTLLGDWYAVKRSSGERTSAYLHRAP